MAINAIKRLQEELNARNTACLGTAIFSTSGRSNTAGTSGTSGGKGTSGSSGTSGTGT